MRPSSAWGGAPLTHAFEATIVERFRDNLSSSDSLLRLSGMAFRAADEYLEQDQRGTSAPWWWPEDGWKCST